ncbi:MAG TPA: hypothetical protein EYP05_06995, partial [Piscirickettsiaceae bacterium]|nr:hypothetical protein [Piscirickettsiaceae bacterium]
MSNETRCLGWAQAEAPPFVGNRCKRAVSNPMTQNFALFFQLLRQEFANRYRGSWLGLLWLILNPLVALFLYTFVLGVVLQAKWHMPEQNTLSVSTYALVIFIGLAVHGAVSEALAIFPRTLLDQPHYIKKVCIPLLVLPTARWAVVIAHNMIVWLVVMLGVLWIGQPTESWFYLPWILLAFWLGLYALSLWLSVLTVFVRDLAHLAGSLGLVLLFLSPVFYPVGRLPQWLQLVAYINPLTFPIEQARNVLLFDQPLNWAGWT